MPLELKQFKKTFAPGTYIYSAMDCTETASFEDDKCKGQGQTIIIDVADGSNGSSFKSDGKTNFQCEYNTNYEYQDCDIYLFSPCYYCYLRTCQADGKTNGDTQQSFSRTADNLKATYNQEGKTEGKKNGRYNAQCKVRFIRVCGDWGGGNESTVSDFPLPDEKASASFNDTYANTLKNTGILCNTQEIVYTQKTTSTIKSVSVNVSTIANSKRTLKYNYPITRTAGTNSTQTKTWSWAFTDTTYTDLTSEKTLKESTAGVTTTEGISTIKVSRCGNINILYDTIILAFPPEAILVGKDKKQGVMVAPDNSYLKYTLTDYTELLTNKTTYQIKDGDYEPPDISTVVEYEIFEIEKRSEKPRITQTVSFIEDLRVIPNKTKTYSQQYGDGYFPPKIKKSRKSFEIKAKGEWDQNKKQTLIIDNGLLTKKIDPIMNTTWKLQNFETPTTYSITYLNQVVPFTKNPKNCKIKYYRKEAEIVSQLKNLVFVDPNTTIGHYGLYLAYTTISHMAAIGTTGPSSKGGSVMSANKSFKLDKDPPHFAFLGRRAIMPTTFVMIDEKNYSPDSITSVTVTGPSFRTNSNRDINKNTETLTVTSSESIVTQGRGLTTFITSPEQAYLDKGTIILYGFFEKTPPIDGKEGEAEYFSEWTAIPVEKALYRDYSRRCKVEPAPGQFISKDEKVANPFMIIRKTFI